MKQPIIGVVKQDEFRYPIRGVGNFLMVSISQPNEVDSFISYYEYSTLQIPDQCLPESAWLSM
jgi:hypothetical protein